MRPKIITNLRNKDTLRNIPVQKGTHFRRVSLFPLFEWILCQELELDSVEFSFILCRKLVFFSFTNWKNCPELSKKGRHTYKKGVSYCNKIVMGGMIPIYRMDKLEGK